MKKFLTIFIVLIMLLTMCGCANSSTNSLKSTSESSIEFPGEMEYLGQSDGYTETFTKNTDTFYYYRDTVTDIMYVTFEEYYKGGLSEMHDPETGLPLTYTRYLELAEQNKNVALIYSDNDTSHDVV